MGGKKLPRVLAWYDFIRMIRNDVNQRLDYGYIVLHRTSVIGGAIGHRWRYLGCARQVVNICQFFLERRLFTSNSVEDNTDYTSNPAVQLSTKI